MKFYNRNESDNDDEGYTEQQQLLEGFTNSCQQLPIVFVLLQKLINDILQSARTVVKHFYLLKI